MWKLRRATASIPKWCARQERSRVCAGLMNVREPEGPRRCFSTYGLLPGGEPGSSPVSRGLFSEGGFRGFSTRIKPSAEESSSDLSESDELEEAATDIKALSESSESELESEDEAEEKADVKDVSDESEGTAVSAAAAKKEKGNKQVLSVSQKRKSLIENDKHEAELWRRTCLLKKEQAMGTLLDSWKEEGLILNQHIVLAVVEKLKNTNKFTHALQVMEYVINDPAFSDFRLAKALLIEVTARAKGIAAAEKIVEDLPEEEKTREVYSALLARYVYLENVKKAEALFEEMEKAGYVSQSPFPINQMMKLYKQKDDKVKFQEMLAKAQNTSVEPNIYTYNVMLDLKARSNDIGGMEKIFEEIRGNPSLKPDAVTYTALAKAYLRAGKFDSAELNMLRLEIGQFRKSKATFEFLMTGYGQLGLISDIERMWQKCKAIPGDGFNSFLVFQRAVAMTGDVKRVEAMFKHMDTWKRGPMIDSKRHNNLLLAYYKKGMLSDAKEQEGKMNELNVKITLTEKDKVPRSAAAQASTFKSSKSKEVVAVAKETKSKNAKKADNKADKGEKSDKADKADNKADKGEKSDKEKELKLRKALEAAADEGDIKAAEVAFENCRKANLTKVGIWNRLLKAYIKAEVPAYGFVQRMESEKVEPDEETQTLLNKLESK